MVDLSGSFSMVLHGTERREFSIGIVKGTVKWLARKCQQNMLQEKIWV